MYLGGTSLLFLYDKFKHTYSTLVWKIISNQFVVISYKSRRAECAYNLHMTMIMKIMNLKLTRHATLCVCMFCAHIHIWAEESRTCVHVFTSVGKLLQQHPEALHYRWGDIVGVNLLHRYRVTPPKHAICQHINRHVQQRL